MVFVLDFNYLRKVTRLLYNQREIYLASLVIWHADIREDRVPVMDFDSFPKQGFFKTTRTFLASLMTSYEEVLEMKSNISWAIRPQAVVLDLDLVRKVTGLLEEHF